MEMKMAISFLNSVRFNNIRSNCKWKYGKSFRLINSERRVEICRITKRCNNNRPPFRRSICVSASAAGVGVDDEGDGRLKSAIDVKGEDHDDDHHHHQNAKEVATKKLDHWLENSVAEIVKNIGEAPLLVHVYTENGADSSASPSSTTTARMKVVIEKTTSKSWNLIKQRWESSCCSMPNGIIWVEQLESKDDSFASQQISHDKCLSLDYPTGSNKDNDRTNLRLMNHHHHHNNNNNNDSSSSSTTKMWGVLVQGREINFPVCYLLKTCQVQCCFGLSTHFCLAKVDCFGNGKGLDFHFNKMWLQR